MFKKARTELSWIGFDVPLDRSWVITETIFLANLLDWCNTLSLLNQSLGWYCKKLNITTTENDIKT